MSIHEMIEKVNGLVSNHIVDMKKIDPEQIGLDPRSCYKLYIDDDCIIVDKRHDSTLQYYGGFEYVTKDHRQELGDYVIYLSGDSRVDQHLYNFIMDDEEEEEI
ncbi:MAG: hypothetical protein ACXW0J_02810 [Nitrososphaeraceae archaeon]